MKWFILVFMLMTSWAFSQEIKVELNPPKPVVGENFSLNFTIPTVGDSDVDISFTPPQSVEVLGRNTEGVSIQSVIINGKVTMKREVVYSYDMRAENVGYFRIRDIYVEQNRKKTKVPDISFSVVKEREKAKDVFLLAHASKNRVFVGEGIDVTYYIYQKVQAGFQTTDFPKLNHFIKRDKIKDRGQEERVNYNGEVFARTALLQSRIFPQKTGKLSIDSMRGIAKIMTMPTMWGGSGGVREKNVYSLPIEIEVMPIPSSNVPKDFTGLVGDHDFKLSINKTKFLTNEVVELKLTVQGYGALESFEGPKIYQDANLEEFEVKSEIQDPLATRAVKVFDYTYLTRGATQIPAKKINFSYFDPATASFKSKSIDVPAITVAGGVAPSAGSGSTMAQADKTNESTINEPKISAPKKSGILAPIFSDNGLEKKYFWRNNWIIILNFILLLALLGFGGLTFLRRDKKVCEDSVASQLSDEIKSKGINYARLHKLLSLLRREHTDDDDATLNRLVEEADFSPEAKIYFKNLISLCEHMGYKSEDTPQDYVYEKRYFKELISLIAKRRYL